MTRKHFIGLAVALKNARATPELVAAIADVCRITNPAFDRSRFYRAAGI